MPVEKCLQIVEECLNEIRSLPEDPLKSITSMKTPAIMELLRHSMDKCYFVWDGTLYKQRDGLPMGGRLSPILANIFMEHLEYGVLSTFQFVPKLYLRYVDDVFIIWDKDRGPHDSFLQALNCQDPNIIMTEELEKDSSLPFLDVLVTRPTFHSDGMKNMPMNLAIYRKPTHIDRYLHYSSAYPPGIKRNGFTGLCLRASQILKDHPWELRSEIRHLKDAFSNKNNGYPMYILNEWYRNFQSSLLKNPNHLNIKTRFVQEEMFNVSGQQIFLVPEASNHFPSLQDTNLPSTEQVAEHGDISERTHANLKTVGREIFATVVVVLFLFIFVLALVLRYHLNSG